MRKNEGIGIRYIFEIGDVIHCETKKDAKLLMSILKEQGIYDTHYDDENLLQRYEEETCYRISSLNDITYGEYDVMLQYCSNIIEFNDLKPKIFTIKGELKENYCEEGECSECNCNNEKEQNDNVNHPSHYTDGKIEVMDFIEDKQLNFARGNAIKYIARAGKKSSEGKSKIEKEIEDLKKSVWYINREIQRLEKEINNDQINEHAPF